MLTKRLIVVAFGVAQVCQLFLIYQIWPTGTVVAVALAAAFALAAMRARERWPLAVLLALAYAMPALTALGVDARQPLLQGLWQAPLLGLMLPRLWQPTWMAPVRWRAPMAAWMLCVGLSWPIVLFRELDFSWAAYASNAWSSIGGVPPASIVGWILTTVTVTGTALLWFEWVCARYGTGSRAEFEREVIRPLAVGAAATVAACLVQMTVRPDILNPTVFAAKGRTGGLFLDGNLAGLVAALWVSIGAWLIVSFGRGSQRAKAIGACLWIALSAAATWSSGSRSALAVMILVSLVSLATMVRRSWFQWRVVSAALVVLAITGAALRWLPVTTIGPVARFRLSVADLPTQTVGAYLKETLWNRDRYGSAAALMIATHPLVGVGVGGYETVVSDYSYRIDGFVLPPDNAQNWFRHQVAELGVVGAAGLFLWTLSVGWTVIRSRPAASDRPVATLALSSVAAVTLISMVGMPTQHPALAVTLLTFLYWYLTALTPAAKAALMGPSASSPALRPARLTPRWHWVAAAAVVVVFLAGTTRAAVRELRPPARAAATGWPYVRGFYKAEHHPPEPDFRWTGPMAVEVIPVSGAWLEFVVRGGPPDANDHPVRFQAWRGRSLVIDTSYDGSMQRVFIRMLPGERWTTIRISTDRPWRPSDFGVADSRLLGVRIDAWRFINVLPPGAVKTG